MSDDLAQQYEAYPYPARDPREEMKQLVTGSPSDLPEIEHYLWRGDLPGSFPPDRPMRILVAGGGTGDATIMLAQQLKDHAIPAELHYIDLSAASRRILESRLRMRELDGVTLHTGSFLDADLPGPFDYIDCCGVIHHLADPPAGLARLAGLLAPGGAIGLMVYGAVGRAGVYELQAVLRQLGGDLPLAQRVTQAKDLLKHLPVTNLFARNPFLNDHRHSDAGVVDLLLNLRDRAYTVEQLADLVAGAGLSIVQWIEPARYEPATYLQRSPRLLQKVADLSPVEQAALAERLAGNITRHVVYLARPGEAAGRRAVLEPDAIPVMPRTDTALLARKLDPGPAVKVDLTGLTLKIALPRLAQAILVRLDGRTRFREIHADLGDLAWERFWPEAQDFSNALMRVNKLMLRRR